MDIIFSTLEVLLAVQEKGSAIEGKINDLNYELNALLTVERRAVLFDASQPMLSISFFSQFRNRELWYAVVRGVDDAFEPDSEYLTSRGWIPALQIFIFLVLVSSFLRNRQKLREKERWRFFAECPFTSAFFLSFMMTVLIYEYQGVPATWKLVNTILASLSFAIFMQSLLEISWRKRVVQGVITVLITTRIFEVLNFPLPIYRLYVVLAAFTGIIFCLRMAQKSIRENDYGFYSWFLRLLAIFFGVVILAEFWGHRSLSSYLFVSMIRTMANILVFSMFMYMVRGGVEWLFNSSPLKRVAVIDSNDTETITRLMAHFLDLLISTLVFIPVILIIWGVYDNLEDATRNLLALGFNIGNQKISISLVLIALSILYCSFLFSWIIQKLLMDGVLFKRQVEVGARHSIASLLHYAIMLVGFLFALTSLGFEISKITIMLSALGVGIGFGLQGVVNNFVSGLILLFEQPVRVGDMIELEGKWARIKKIGLRATTVQTLEDADVVVPNADLVSNQVTNWTLSNRRARLMIPVGVAYGVDVPLVMETLIASARDHKGVVNYPSPQVLFLEFGESSLNFELRVWVKEAENRLSVSSDLHQEIDRRFREADIEMAFPQRDLHLRSIDNSVIIPFPEHAK